MSDRQFNEASLMTTVDQTEWGTTMSALQTAYFRWVFHPHFVLVHFVGLAFGLHLAIASSFAIAHHARRSAPNNRRKPPAGAYDEVVAEAIGMRRWADAA